MKTATPAARKPRLPKMGFHKTSGQFRVYLNRREIYLGADREEAETRYRQEVAAWLARSCQAPPPAPDDLRVLELCNRYTKHAREYYAACPANVDRLKVWFQPFIDLCGTIPAVDFTPQLLKAVRTEMVNGRPADPETGKGGRHGWTRKYVNQAVQAITRMYKWAASEGLIPVAAWQALTTVEGLRKGFCVAKESKTRQAIQPEELEAVRGYLPAPVMAALEVMYLCGARPSEVLNLQPCDIDRTGEVWRVELERHKTAHLDKPRALHFGPQAQRILKPYLLRADDAYLFSPKESAQDAIDRRHADRVTPEKQGNNIGTNRVKRPKTIPGDHYDHAAFRRCIARAVSYVNRDRVKQNIERKAAGLGEFPMLRQFCPYEARHSAAVRIRDAVSLDAVQAVLGHSKIDMSAHYAKLNGELAAAVMAKLG